MIITFVKIIVGIIHFILVEHHPKRNLAQSYVPAKSMYIVIEDSIRLRAYKILSNKCNVCHEKRNRRRVFTDENMKPWANDIYKQVFIKKRMPKGKKIKLTNTEYQELFYVDMLHKNSEQWNLKSKQSYFYLASFLQDLQQDYVLLG